MAEATAFATRLTALGFEQPARTALALQGLQTAADLLSLTTKDLEKLISHCQNEVRNMARDPAIPRPVFPFLAVKRLQAFYLWTSYQDSRGQPIRPVLFLPAVTMRWMDRIAFLERLENDQEIPTPLPLTSFDDWVAWLESLLAWARHMRSARMGTPFSYLLRDHQDVTPEMLATAYDSIDDELVSTVILAGPSYEHDNQLLFDHLRGWLREGPAWPFMQLHARSMNGRAAFFAVKAQAEGQAALTSRRARAYASIQTARYTGRSRFSFDSYILRHQKANNELFALGEVISETKKVQDFLSGITDPSYDTAKTLVCGDNTKLESFEACQQFLKTVAQFSKTTASATNAKRGVSAVGTNKNRSKGGGKKPPAKGGKGSKDGPNEPPHYGHYSNEEYRALNERQRMKLKQHREKNDDKGSAKKRRTSAVVSSDVDEDEDEDEPTPPPKKKKTKNGRSVKLVSTQETRPKHIVKFANAAGQKAMGNKPFEDWEDPVWVYHQPTPKIWKSRVEATFYRIAGIDKPAELPMLDGKFLSIEEHRSIRRAKEAYLDQLERLNDKKEHRARPYGHNSAHFAWTLKLRLIPAILEDGDEEGAKVCQQEADDIKAAYELQRKEALMKAPVMADQFGRASAIANSV
jgi:hypothetical protein